MAKTMQLTVCLENKPGQAAKVGDTLRRAGVNILAISVVETTDTGVIRLIADRASTAAAALDKAGMKVTRQNVLTVSLPNEPGALGTMAGKLSRAGVNINYLYGSAPKGAEEATVIIGVDDVERAMKVAG